MSVSTEEPMAEG